MSIYRLVRSIPAEKYQLGHPEPFAPLYDVEEVGAYGEPVRLLAAAVGAEAARAVIAKVAGDRAQLGRAAEKKSAEPQSLARRLSAAQRTRTTHPEAIVG